MCICGCNHHVFALQLRAIKVEQVEIAQLADLAGDRAREAVVVEHQPRAQAGEQADLRGDVALQLVLVE